MLTIISAIILTIVFLIIAEPILYLFGASDKTFPYAVSYYRIYVLGTFPVLIALGLNNFISCQGFAKTSMMTVLIGAIINIVLDPIFIFLFNMGVSGAALATIISQAVSAIWVFKFLMSKKSMLHIKKSILRLKSDIVKKVIALGSSPFTMMAMESLLILSFNNSLQKYGGDIAVGAMTIMFSLMQMMLLPLNGFSQGLQPIISYNYGAGNKERIEKAFRILFFASLAFSTVFWLTIIVFPNIYAMIFTTNLQLMAITESSIRVYLMLLFLMGIQVACQNTFIAIGRAKISLFLAALRKIILLIPLIFILPKLLDDKVFTVLLAEPVSDVIAVSVTVILFKLNFHKIIDGRIRVLNNAD